MKQYLLNLLLATIAILSPIKEAMFTVGALIFIDLMLGVYASYKNNIKIESKKLKNTVVKTLVYQVVIISAFICESYLVNIIPFLKVTLAFIAIVEFKSIAENMTKITGKDFYSYIKSFINTKLNQVENTKHLDDNLTNKKNKKQ